MIKDDKVSVFKLDAQRPLAAFMFFLDGMDKGRRGRVVGRYVAFKIQCAGIWSIVGYGPRTVYAPPHRMHTEHVRE